MVSRRRFMAGALAASTVSSVSWAGLGGVRFLSAAQAPDGAYQLHGLSETGTSLFALPLPARGHAAAAHPTAAEAVGFARRPGDFAFVIDVSSGAVLKRLQSPEGRHFYGHGAFSLDGRVLYTTENDYDAGEGVIGVWDRAAGYVRIGEFPSGGVGPHEMRRMPGSDVLVVANGGIETHPETGRNKLNIPMMEPNLAYLSPEGELLDMVEMPREMHKNSIRHIAIREDGLVAFGMQWQGDRATAPVLFGTHKRGSDARLLQPSDSDHAALQAYVGSVAFSRDGREVAISSPRGGVVQIVDVETMTVARRVEMTDVCGIGAYEAGFMLTSGDGRVALFEGTRVLAGPQHDLRWDNHMVGV